MPQWYLSGSTEHHQLNGSSGIALRGHGTSQCLHGSVVGMSQQRFTIYSNQLVVDGQTSVLQHRNKNKNRSILKHLLFGYLHLNEEIELKVTPLPSYSSFCQLIKTTSH